MGTDNPNGATTRARIYAADTWHVDDGTGTDGNPPYHHSPVRRAFTPEYKLAILAEYDGCTETGQKARCCAAKACTRA